MEIWRITIFLVGVCRQTLQIVPCGTRVDEVKACIKSSYLCPIIFAPQNFLLSKTWGCTWEQMSQLAISQTFQLNLGKGVYPESNGKVTISDGRFAVVNSLTELMYYVLILRKSPLAGYASVPFWTPRMARLKSLIIHSFNHFKRHTWSAEFVNSMLQMIEAIRYPVTFWNFLNPPGFLSHGLLLKVYLLLLFQLGFCLESINPNYVTATAANEQILEIDCLIEGCFLHGHAFTWSSQDWAPPVTW